MMEKRILAILLGLLMVVMPVAAGDVSATTTSTGTTVILVSDNIADQTLAEYIANITGAVVVTTTWGVYDPNVTSEILSYSPDTVIIIGGPDAVVAEYTSELDNINTTVYRWGGENRYETDMAVITNATKMFGIKFNGSVLVPGNDSIALQKALKLALQNHSVVIYVNETTNVTAIMEKLRVRNTVMVQTMASERVMEKIREQLRACNCTAAEIQANATEKELEKSMEKIMKRLALLNETANTTNSSELMVQVQEMTQLMEKINQALAALQ